METGSYDTSRLFSNQTGPYCDGWRIDYPCPYCSCPSGKVAQDTWYHDFLRFTDESAIGCAQCKCLENDQGILYTDCSDLSESFDAFSIHQGCSEISSLTSLSCHNQYNQDSGTDYFILIQPQKTVNYLLILRDRQ